MFTRTLEAIGPDAFRRLQESRVILFGVGGVGGWCAEALVRSGVQHLTIVDFDVVSTSNLNRQLVALSDNIGTSKVQSLRARLLAINPQATITAIDQKYEPSTAHLFSLNDYDYIIDAIDSLDCKVHLILNATASTATFFSSMGAARKWDAGAAQVAEFWKVVGCPLARALRTRMRKDKTLPAKKFLCVYSPELSASSGSLAHVVGTFGFRLADLVIRDILSKSVK